MNRAFLVAWVSAQVLTVPSIAEAATFTLNDEPLYLRHAEDRVTIIRGAALRWGYRRAWASHQIRDRVYLTRGDVPLCEDRFADLINTTGMLNGNLSPTGLSTLQSLGSNRAEYNF